MNKLVEYAAVQPSPIERDCMAPAKSLPLSLGWTRQHDDHDAVRRVSIVEAWKPGSFKSEAEKWAVRK